MPDRWPFRKLLPLVMTSVQMLLLLLSLAQKFHLPTNPAELHRKYPPTAPWVDGVEDGTVTFSPGPEDMRTTTLFKVAMLLSLPAMILGMLIGNPLIAMGLQGGESFWIAMGALMGIWLWSRIGRWADSQREIKVGTVIVRSRFYELRRGLLRALAILLFLAFAFDLTPANHHRTAETVLSASAGIAWSGIYLLLSFWGESRETKLARVIAEPPSAHRL